ncbi:MAG: hypothetical protein KKI15_02705 [Proteobacteria bacterium]|nr:hypothetical protein [Pseudomonadota bacterium]
MIDFLLFIVTVSFFSAFLSILKMFFYLKAKGSDAQWGGAGLLNVFGEYIEETKAKTGIVGLWFKVFVISFSIMMFAIFLTMLLA